VLVAAVAGEVEPAVCAPAGKANNNAMDISSQKKRTITASIFKNSMRDLDLGTKVIDDLGIGFLPLIDDFSTHNRRHDFPHELPAVKRRIAR